MLHVSEFAVCRDPQLSLQPAVGIKFIELHAGMHNRYFIHPSRKYTCIFYTWVLMDFCVAVHGTCDIAKEVKRYNINSLTVSLLDGQIIMLRSFNAWY